MSIIHMTVERLTGEAEILRRKLSDKGYTNVLCNISIHHDGDQTLSLTGMNARGEYKNFTAYSFQGDMIALAHNYIDKLPMGEDAKNLTFRKKIYKLIDQGNQLGIDMMYLNPLVEVADKLATNALTHNPLPESPDGK